MAVETSQNPVLIHFLKRIKYMAFDQSPNLNDLKRRVPVLILFAYFCMLVLYEFLSTFHKKIKCLDHMRCAIEFTKRPDGAE